MLDWKRAKEWVQELGYSDLLVRCCPSWPTPVMIVQAISAAGSNVGAALPRTCAASLAISSFLRVLTWGNNLSLARSSLAGRTAEHCGQVCVN